MEVDSLKNIGSIPNSTNVQNVATKSDVSEPKAEKIEFKKLIKLNEKAKETSDEFNPKYFDKMLKDINKKLVGTRKQFSYHYHEEAKRVAVQVIDSDTTEVLKEIPPEKSLDAIAKMLEIAGLIFDEKI